MKPNGIELEDWLTTESVRRREQSAGRWPDDEAAMTIARESDQGLAQRLVQRARALPGVGSISTDLRLLKRWARRFLLLLCLLGLGSGWLAAQASIADRQIDLLLAAFTLIGLPAVFLLLWLIVWFLGLSRGKSRGLLSGMAARGLDWLGPRLFTSELSVELARSSASVLAQPVGRWWLSLGTHLLWLFFSLGAVTALMLYFSVAQYDLSWGTTILNEQAVVHLVQALAWLPSQLGLVSPLSAEFIERGRVGSLPSADRSQWAQLLMVMVMVYVTVPRLLLVLLSLLRLRTVRRSVPLNLGEPAYLRLESELMDGAGAERLLGQAPELWPEKALRPRPARAGRPALVDLELNAGSRGLLAEALEDRVMYLGVVDGRAQRGALVEALKALDPPPVQLWVVCSLRRTPDRGTARLLDRLADAARSALVLAMIDRESVRQRGGDANARIEDWQRLGRHVGGQVCLIEREGSGPFAIDPLLAHLEEWK